MNYINVRNDPTVFSRTEHILVWYRRELQRRVVVVNVRVVSVTVSAGPLVLERTASAQVYAYACKVAFGHSN